MSDKRRRRIEAALPLDALRLEPWSSGDTWLVLSREVSWDAFPSVAGRFAKWCGGKIVQGGDTVDIRVRTIRVEGVDLQLGWDENADMEDDGGPKVMLIATDSEESQVLMSLHERLSGAR